MLSRCSPTSVMALVRSCEQQQNVKWPVWGCLDDRAGRHCSHRQGVHCAVALSAPNSNAHDTCLLHGPFQPTTRTSDGLACMQEEHLRLENLSLKAQNRQLMTRALRSASSPPPSATPPRAASPDPVHMDSVCLLDPDCSEQPQNAAARHLCLACMSSPGVHMHQGLLQEAVAGGPGSSAAWGLARP